MRFPVDVTVDARVMSLFYFCSIQMLMMKWWWNCCCYCFCRSWCKFCCYCFGLSCALLCKVRLFIIIFVSLQLLLLLLLLLPIFSVECHFLYKNKFNLLCYLILCCMISKLRVVRGSFLSVSSSFFFMIIHCHLIFMFVLKKHCKWKLMVNWVNALWRQRQKKLWK